MLVADGSVELRVLETDGVTAYCEVVRGGPISDSKGINLPGVQVSTPSLTKKDIADLRFGLDLGVDMVALSFVRKREDVLRLRIHLEDADSARIPVISKIEKPEAWTNIDSILSESDGVMVARGDLGVEMALEKVPPIQKGIIRKARELWKVCDHGHADAGDDDRPSVPDQGGGERHCQCHLRRDRRGDVVGPRRRRGGSRLKRCR